MPHPPGIIPGGVTGLLADSTIADLVGIAGKITTFIDGAYAEDIAALSEDFADYAEIGVSGAAYLSFGAFSLDDGSLFLPKGYLEPNSSSAVAFDPSQISESTAHAKFGLDNGGHPSRGRTDPSMDRVDAYSWIKAARLAGKPCEVGPVARTAIAGQPLGRGVLGRHQARQKEASRLIQAMKVWLSKLSVNESGLPVFPNVPISGEGQGLVEGPRGCLGHWLTIENAVIAHYGVVTPTTWNASPRDDQGEPGPMEQAMQGVSVANANDPIEVVRVVHSFDPCLQCAVH